VTLLSFLFLSWLSSVDEEATLALYRQQQRQANDNWQFSCMADGSPIFLEILFSRSSFHLQRRFFSFSVVLIKSVPDRLPEIIRANTFTYLHVYL
jgi:hypothetical protein